ncbi:hypothetical protein K493DRAFT_42254 [Basidiobolus meristosporus CBS 931.73]|uniref:Uncharacterized protein n=1 Tax=Basidiobolus meristosporus CBS 931.73 TaxID=1314790 RepID=A0A1Y1Y3X0_9FUNG|nr:hypothetical protein K493DRAFT_42254 [Basidiobolus meristosporus CBS 931.73]|eukprot:ORX92585.1 hypothetical protein K493DRAFT_42254 [Basidiobolus meristosporus CBS 931.73]
MDRTDHAANLIGNYLLKGWVLMDAVCPNPSCSVPLMRSKDKKIQFCVLCDDPERKQTQEPVIQSPENTNSTVELEEVEKKRAQSQTASKLIGEKLLQGWAMLNDICPNETCYGVPLIRNKREKHLYCVICQRNYIKEEDADLKNETLQKANPSDSEEITQAQPVSQTSSC